MSARPCVYVCACVCLYLRVRTNTCVYLCVYMCVCTCVCMFVCVCARASAERKVDKKASVLCYYELQYTKLIKTGVSNTSRMRSVRNMMVLQHTATHCNNTLQVFRIHLGCEVSETSLRSLFTIIDVNTYVNTHANTHTHMHTHTHTHAHKHTRTRTRAQCVTHAQCVSCASTSTNSEQRVRSCTPT